MVAVDGSSLAMVLPTGAKLKVEPWDGDVFTARLAPEGRYAVVAENTGPRPVAFVQFQIDAAGKPNVLHLSFDDGQAYEFRRE